MELARSPLLSYSLCCMSLSCVRSSVGMVYWRRMFLSTRKSKLSLSSGEVAELFEMLTMFYDRLLLPAHINLTQP